MADATYAIVDKAKKSVRVSQSSEVNRAIYTAVDKSKKKKNRNVRTAGSTSSMFNRDALQEPAMEEAESEYSMINAERVKVTLSHKQRQHRRKPQRREGKYP